MSKKGVVVAKSSGMVVGTGAKRHHAWHVGPHMRLALLGVVALVVLGGVVCGIAAYRGSGQSGYKPKKSTQAQLQDNINNAYQINDSDALKLDATTLINGAASGKYRVTKQQLGAAYLGRANAQLNKKEYKAAVSDYEQARTQDSKLTLASLQGEVESRYKLGERKELIPLYQQLIDLESKSENPLRNGHLEQYQANIAALQKGQEISF
jgi:hypothetical protein